jgi:molybdate transport system substrate-binding protein
MRDTPLVACVILLLAGDVPVSAESVDTITVFAAASTSETVRTVAADYEAARHVTVRCCFASSSILARQIEQGAPADIFLSADGQWMDYLATRKAIVAASRVDLLANGLVLIAPVGKPLMVTVEKGFRIGDAFSGRLAIGDPTNVPAGIYAKEAFTHLGWWEALSPRLAPTADVRAALKLVELGEVDAGVVYATDAKASTRVVVAATIPARCHQPIRYPVALVTTAKPAAVAFLAHLQGPVAWAVFARAGFTAPTAADAQSAPAPP